MTNAVRTLEKKAAESAQNKFEQVWLKLAEANKATLSFLEKKKANNMMDF